MNEESANIYRDEEGYDVVDGRRVIITMADGTRRKNLDDFILPYNKKTAPAFDIARRIAEEAYKKQVSG